MSAWPKPPVRQFARSPFEQALDRWFPRFIWIVIAILVVLVAAGTSP